MDQGRAGLLLGLDGCGVGVVIGALGQNDLRAQPLGCLHLADGGAVRHINHAAHALPRGGQGHALGMVAGAAGNNTGFFLLLRQLADLIVSASQLEAAGDL